MPVTCCISDFDLDHLMTHVNMLIKHHCLIVRLFNKPNKTQEPTYPIVGLASLPSVLRVLFRDIRND